jgi:hypothetical protein
MRRIVLLAVALVGWLQPPAVLEQGTLRLHYVQKPIGTERYEIAKAPGAGGLQLTADFDFTDRGGRVQLAATLRTAADLTPVHFSAKGKSYRFVNVDSAIDISGRAATVRADGSETRVTLPAEFYTVDGYAPFSAQMMMLRYWKQHGRPRVLTTVPGLPANEVIIEARGRDEATIAGRAMALDRFVVDGVVWGRETIWLDERGSLAAAITRAGGLSFEAVREDLESGLPWFVERGTRDRLADLEEITRRTAPMKTGAYALVGATIVDAVGDRAIPDGVVVVRDGRIADVGPRASVTIPSGVETVDIAGKTIVPGLWDMHTHVTQIEWAPVYLGAGVTTVRDMGNEFEFVTALRDAIVARRAAGPRLLLAGLIDGGGPNAFGVYYAGHARRRKTRGREVPRRGFSADQDLQLDYAADRRSHLRRSASSGHDRHRPHSHRDVDRAGGVSRDGSDRAPADSRRGGLGRGHAHDRFSEGSQNGDGSDAIVERIARTRRRRAGCGVPARDRENPAAAQPAVLECRHGRRRRRHRAQPCRTRLAHRQSAARCRRGGCGRHRRGNPRPQRHREIELYVEAGLTPLQALQAATIVPARVMKLDADLGDDRARQARGPRRPRRESARRHSEYPARAVDAQRRPDVRQRGVVEERSLSALRVAQGLSPAIRPPRRRLGLAFRAPSRGPQ